MRSMLHCACASSNFLGFEARAPLFYGKSAGIGSRVMTIQLLFGPLELRMLNFLVGIAMSSRFSQNGLAFETRDRV